MFVFKFFICVCGVGWVDNSLIGCFLLFVVFIFFYRLIDWWGLKLDWVISCKLMMFVLDLCVWLKGNWIFICMFKFIVVIMGLDWGILLVVRICFIVCELILISVDWDICLLLCLVMIWLILWLIIVVNWCWFFVIVNRLVYMLILLSGRVNVFICLLLNMMIFYCLLNIVLGICVVIVLVIYLI